MKNPTPPRNPRKQRGISLLNVVLGLGVFAAVSAMTINMFIGASDTATNQGAVNEIASAMTKADSHSAMYGRNTPTARCPSAEALFGVTGVGGGGGGGAGATNVYGQTINDPTCTGGNIAIVYTINLPTGLRAEEACDYILDRINRTTFNSIVGTPACSGSGQSRSITFTIQ